MGREVKEGGRVWSKEGRRGKCPFKCGARRGTEAVDLKIFLVFFLK